MIPKSTLWFSAITALVVPLPCPAEDAKPPRPNIIFILCDDLGYGDLGVFFQNHGAGGRMPKVGMKATPHLDELAAEGMQLRGHYCPAPVCAPSRASFLSGVHQGHANVRDNQFDKALEDNHTVASVLKEAGYHTVCIGKWGLQGGKKMPAHPLKRGFDEYFGYISHVAGHLHYPKEDGKKLHEGTRVVGPDYDKCYTTDLFTARAKKTLIEQHRDRKDQPLFLYLAYDTPHAKTQLPPCAYPAGGGVEGGVRWLGKPGRMINTATGVVDSWYYPEHGNATWDDPKRPGRANPWPDVAKRYATMVRRIDDCVFDLVTTLRDLDMERDTLVVFTSDNGPSMESYLKGKDAAGYPRDFNPGFFRGYGPFDGIKRDCYEGGVRVGAIVRWPGTVPAGKVSERASQFHDWMPTFAELAGIPAPARTDGVSMVPEITGKGDPAASTVYVEYTNGSKTPGQPDFLASRRNGVRKQMQMIREGNLVGVRYDIQSHDDDFEIYDVVKDPGQRENLAAGMKDRQQAMKDRVLQIRRPNASAPRPYDDLAVPTDPPEGKTSAGLEMTVHKVNVPWAVDDRSLPAGSPEKVKELSLPASAGGEGHAVVFRGWIKVPVDDDYTFALPDTCRAVVKIHDATLIDADRGRESSGTIKLKAGLHPILLSVRGGEPRLEWSTSTMKRSVVPAAAFVTSVP